MTHHDKLEGFFVSKMNLTCPSGDGSAQCLEKCVLFRSYRLPSVFYLSFLDFQQNHFTGFAKKAQFKFCRLFVEFFPCTRGT